MILNYNNINFQDIRYEIDFLNEETMEVECLDRPKDLQYFPYLDFNKINVYESSAIEQFISDIYNMNGKEYNEKAKIYSICDYIKIIKEEYQLFKILNKEENEKIFFKKILNNHLKFINDNIFEDTTTFSVSNNITRLDFVIYNFIKYYFIDKVTLMKILPKYKNILKLIKNLEKDKQFIIVLSKTKETLY